MFGDPVDNTLGVQDEEYQQASNDNRHGANNQHYIIARPTLRGYQAIHHNCAFDSLQMPQHIDERSDCSD